MSRGRAGIAALVLILLGFAMGACQGSGEAPSPSRGQGGTVEAPDLRGRIVFNTVRGDLWVMDADGSDRRQLTRSGKGTDYNPTWSPDGGRIAFRTTRGESGAGVDPSNSFVVNADGSGERQ